MAPADQVQPIPAPLAVMGMAVNFGRELFSNTTIPQGHALRRAPADFYFRPKENPMRIFSPEHRGTFAAYTSLGIVCISLAVESVFLAFLLQLLLAAGLFGIAPFAPFSSSTPGISPLVLYAMLALSWLGACSAPVFALQLIDKLDGLVAWFNRSQAIRHGIEKHREQNTLAIVVNAMRAGITYATAFTFLWESCALGRRIVHMRIQIDGATFNTLYGGVFCICGSIFLSWVAYSFFTREAISGFNEMKRKDVK